MAKFTSLILVGAMLVATTGCAGFDYARAKSKPAASGAYDQSLQKGYLDLSKGEFNEGDYPDSDAFAERSMAAANGSPPQPEQIGARKLPADKVDELTTARQRLVAAQGESWTQKNPEATARAQVMFDCWMQEQEENFQPKDIARCRDGFYKALGELEVAAGPGSYLVFFDFDSSKVTAEGSDVVATAASNAKSENASAIIAVGHTDTVGSAEYNMGLSQRRADSVASALVKNGIPAGAITTEARGETDPLVPTGDGVAEPQNRRVEINVVRPEPGS
jgi:OmpA-OmpF porin, OOP family